MNDKFKKIVEAGVAAARGRPPGSASRALVQTRLELEATQRSMRMLTCAVEHSPVTVVITDTTGTIEYANPSFTKTTGYTLDEVRGKNVRIMKGGEVPPEIYRDLWQTIDSGRDWRGVFHNRKKNGELFWESATISPVFDEAHRITHFLAVKEDITGFKHAQDLLKEHQALLGQIQKLGRVGGWKRDVRTGRYTWTEAVFRITETDPAHGPRGFDLCEPASRRIIDRALQLAVETGDPFDVELEIVTALGSPRQVHVIGQADPGRTEVVGLIQDVSERKAAEAELRRNETRFHSMANVLEFRAETLPQYLTFALAEAVKVTESGFGYLSLYFEDKQQFVLSTGANATLPGAGDTESRIGRELAGLGVWEEVLRDRQPIVRKLPPGEADRGPRPREHLRGFIALPVSRAGRIEAVLIVANRGRDYSEKDVVELRLLMDAAWNVVEQRSAMESQGVSEERFRRAIVDSPLPVMLHAEDGQVVMISGSWTEVSGYALSDIPTIAAWTEQAYGDRAPHHRAAIQQLYSLEKRHQHGEQAVRTKTGETRLWDFVSAPLGRLSDGRRMVVSMAVDMTERRQAEATLKQTEEQFRQAQKMEAVGQLAGGVAHDFNNILAGVLMHLGLLQDEPSLDPATRTALKELEKEAQRGAVLTRQLLAFSRQQAMQPEVIDLKGVLQGLLKMLRRLLGEHIEVLLAGPDGLPGVNADSGMIEQVVINLCVNARDAMPKGGRLILHLEQVEIGSAEAAGTAEARAGSFLRLSVTDTGHGMDNSILEHIFEPFFTTKGAGKGTGLGLPTVYGIVKQHRGWVDVRSEVGRGTTFRVHLPACPGVAGARPTSEAVRPPSGRGELILVVEDENSLRTVTVAALQRNGYRAVAAVNGPDALRVWEAHRGGIDLVLTDMVMPGEMNGRDLVVRLRTERPDLKAVACSGYTQEPTLQDLEGIRVALLRKPFTMPALLHTIRQSLDTGR
jgi:PAS domain S-box-containing protein